MLYLRPAIRELGAWIAGGRPVRGRALDLGRDENGCQEARPVRCSHGLSDRPWPCRMRPWPTASRLAAASAGAVEVTAPRVNDKRTDPATGERNRFSSAILPPWARKTPQVSEVLPLLYLHGLSSGDFVP